VLEHLQQSPEKLSLKTCFRGHPKKYECQFSTPPPTSLKVDLIILLIGHVSISVHNTDCCVRKSSMWALKLPLFLGTNEMNLGRK
jgi:hypothetical protein